jgi:hypothetical protein
MEGSIPVYVYLIFSDWFCLFCLIIIQVIFDAFA